MLILESLIDVLVGIFHPFYVFKRKKGQGNESKIKYVLSFILVVGLGLLLFHLLNPSAYVSMNINIVSKVGFVLGLSMRILLSSYLIGLLTSKITKSKLEFNRSISIVVTSTASLFFPFLFQWINPDIYLISQYFCLLWYLSILSIGILILFNCRIHHAILIACITQLLYWFIGSCFLPWGIVL